MILDDAPADLQGGLTSTRLALNLFEFRLDDETLQVDLSLPPGQTFRPRYLLPSSCAGRDYFSIIHCGDGNGWDPGQPGLGSVRLFRALSQGGYRSYAHWADVVARDVLRGIVAETGEEGISEGFFSV